MIAASGARIVTNFSSNMHLRSGLAPDRRRAPMRLRHRGRRRWPGAGRGRRRAARDAAGADDARRSRLQADLDVQPNSLRPPSATAARRPARRERRAWCRARPPTSSRSISIGSIATGSCRSIRSICCLRAATRRCCDDVVVDGRADRPATAAVPASIFPRSRQSCADIYRANAESSRRFPARMAAAFGVAAKLVRSATGLPLAAWRSREIPLATSNSVAIAERKFRLHQQAGKVSWSATTNGTGVRCAGHTGHEGA